MTRYYTMVRFAFTIVAIVTLILASATNLWASEPTADGAQVKAKEGFIFDKEAGGKFTMDANAEYESLLFGRPCLVEFETIYSRYAGPNLDAFGGYLQGQYSIFDSKTLGELVPFVRYDLSHISSDGSATQQAIRTGINLNLQLTRKHVNLHFEYAKNMLSESDRILTSGDRDFDEFAIMLRVSTTPYTPF